MAEDGQQLRQIAIQMIQDMAENATETVESILKDENNSNAMDGLSSNRSYPNCTQVSDQFTAYWHLDKSILSKVPLKRNSPVLFAIDPDNFNPENQEHICNALLWNTDKVTEVTFTDEEYQKIWHHTPLYLLSYEGIAENLEPQAAKLNAVPGDYAIIRGFHQKKKMDTWGNMEIKIATASNVPDGYSHVTNLIFDGGTHTDAAGRSLWFPDVNNTSTFYRWGNRIALVYAGNSSNHGWIVEEDDDGPMNTFNHAWVGPGDPPPYPVCYYQTYVDVKNACAPRVNHQLRKIWYNRYISFQSDDLATSGAYEGYDLSWNLEYNTEHSEALDHNRFLVYRVNSSEL